MEDQGMELRVYEGVWGWGGGGAGEGWDGNRNNWEGCTDLWGVLTFAGLR